MDRHLEIHPIRPFALAIFGCLLLAPVSGANPLPPPPQIHTEAELREMLQDNHQGAVHAAEAVAHAAHLHRDLIDAVLASPNVRAWIQGVLALESLGDLEARDRMLTLLEDARQDAAVRVAAAESLAKLGDERAILLIRGCLTEINGVEWPGMQQALTAFDDPLAFEPLITVVRDAVRFAFLLDDVVSIAVCRPVIDPQTFTVSMQPVLPLALEDHAEVLDLMQYHEVAKTSVLVEDKYLVIRLRSGHEAALLLSGDVVHYSDRSRQHRPPFFTLRMPDLAAFVAARLDEAGLPANSIMGPIQKSPG